MLKLTSILLGVAALVQGAIWQPARGTSYQLILSKTIKINSTRPYVTPNALAYEIDLFDNQDDGVITSLHKLNKKVICYFSAGSAEDWRSDYSQFPASAKGKPLAGWAGEVWIDTRDATVRKIMANRIKLASQIGCDAIDPDNIDVYSNDSGLPLTEQDAVNYVKFLASTAAQYGLATGLKNALDIVSSVASVVQFAVNESCSFYNECTYYATFAKTKPVFHIEYWEAKKWKTNPCSEMPNTGGFTTVIKYQNLDGRVTYCDGKSYTTSTN